METDEQRHETEQSWNTGKYNKQNKTKIKTGQKKERKYRNKQKIEWMFK